MSEEEAYTAMRSILMDQVEPVQTGAFLMLLRVKKESPEEMAGFIGAAQNLIESPESPETAQSITLDWPAYAGKRRQLPWFTLSARLLSENGVRILMHGAIGNKADRIYTPQAVEFSGIRSCRSLEESASCIQDEGIAYISLETF